MRVGLLSLLAGTVVLLGGLDADAGPEVVFVPMLLVGLGIGALASQLGAVTVSAVPDDESPEVGGLQNTMTNLGASLGTALAGSLLIATLTSAFLTNVQQSDAIPASAKEQAQVELAGGVAFVSDADLEAALDEAGVDPATTDATLDAYGEARLAGLRSALAILAVLAIVALFLAQSIPTDAAGRRREKGVTMCRWLAYSGTPIRMEELLLKRERSLIDQSLHAQLGATTTNGDGFGVGWYEDGGAAAEAVPQHASGLERPQPPRARRRGRLAALLRAHPRVDRHGDPGDEHAPVPPRTLALDAQRPDPRVPARAA